MDWLRKRVADGSLLFGLLPIVYFLLYGFDGFADTDQGFVPGLAWRVHQGQVPYLDFIYVRPPLTPVLHALELWLWPLEGQMLGMRFDFYLMMAGSVLFGILTLRRWFDFHGLGIQPWMLGVLAFLFGVHNFPAMPWHTVDGIFFGSLGIWLVTHPNSVWQMVFGLFALALAGLAKQPFAVMLPLGFLWIIWAQYRQNKILKISLIAIGGMATTTGCLLLLLPNGFAKAMLNQVSGASSWSDLANVGFIGYLLPLAFFIVSTGVLFKLGGKANPSRQIWLGRALLAGLALIPMAHAGLAFWKMEFVPPRLGYCHVLLLAGFAYAILQWRPYQRVSASALLMMCALSWASSISWGYAMPAQFALPGLFGFFGLLRMALPGFKIGNVAMRWLAGLVFVGFFLLNLLPYRDAPRWELKAGAGEIFPQLAGISVGPETLEKLHSLKALDLTYNGKIAIFPAQPGFSYLTQRQPMLDVDWEHDAEIGPANMAAFLQDLNTSSIFVAIEKSRTGEANSANAHYGSQVLKAVLDHWTKVDSVPHFDVYALHPSP